MAVCAGLVLVSAGVILYCRADKTQVFYETRGRYREARVLESWDTGASRVERVAFANQRNDDVVQAYVRTPISLAEDYDILLVYAGLETREKLLSLLSERADQVLVAVQYPYDKPEGIFDYIRSPYEVRRAAFRTVAGGMLALSFLEETRKLDASRVIVIGSSLGSPFATIHGALDERVGTVVLVHGGGDFPRIIEAHESRLREKGEPVWLLKAASSAFLYSFDPVHYVDRIAPRRLVMIASRRDRHFPVESIEALYDRALEPKQIVWTETDHVGSTETELVRKVMRQLEQTLARLDAGD